MQSHSQRPSSPADTRQRLLDAAARVFARDGINGATTRAIAEEAGVNEVTLFRHFGSKDGLLDAVVGQNFGPGAQVAVEAPPAMTNDLRRDLLEHANRYNRLLESNLRLVRTMVGEIQHHRREQEREVFQGIFRPVKAAIFARIEAAQNAGELRSDIRPGLLADLFGAMVFTGAVRRDGLAMKLEYSASTYLESVVDLVLRGASSGPLRDE